MATTGYEDEFRALFAEEAAQRLTDLATQLIALEDAPTDPELVGSIFREAHTLKGAAAVVGFDDVQAIAHAMEDILADVRSGARLATAPLIDGLLSAVDGIREVMAGGLAGEDQSARSRLHVEALQTLVAEHASSPAPAATGAIGSPAPPADASPAGAAQPEPPPQSPPSGEEEAAAPVAASRRGTPDAESVRVSLARLDEIVRLVGESAAAHLRVGRVLGDHLGRDPAAIDEVRELSRMLNQLQELTMRARMVPVVMITDVLQRAVRDVARITGKRAVFEVRGEDTELDRGVLQQLSDPLLHMVRNAVDHGIETPAERAAVGKPEEGTVRFHAMQIGSEVILTITDDGRGIDAEKVRDAAARHDPDLANLSDEDALYLIFRSGFSTSDFVTDISGRGVGLDVVRANVDAVRGRMEIRSEVGQGSELRIIVPITLAVLPCLLVEAGGRRHAIPMHSVLVAQAGGGEVAGDGRHSVWYGDRAVPLSGLAATLGLPDGDDGPVVVLSGMTRRHAFRVGAIVGQRDVVVKGLSRLLPRLEVLAGASVEPDGAILPVLDAPGLIDRARSHRGAAIPHAVAAGTATPAATHRARILVVDDALTVRELQRAILERAGYLVATAADGVEAMAKLGELPVDLVLTDVEMPRLDGFGLTEAIRAHPQQSNVPVLILTSRASEEDRLRGLHAGADGYIIKSAFDEASLLSAVERLLGR